LTDQREIHSVVFETSPYGTVDAIVEHDGRAIYFYLNENPVSRQRSGRFGMRACWVRNLQLGPHVINVDEMQAGIATMLPRHDCIDPMLQRLPAADALKVVWLEEGTGAALLEIDPTDQTEDVIAVIPPWSGVDGFHGYASNCANETDVCWPLPDNPLLKKRIDNAKQFWADWRTEGEDGRPTPWQSRLPEIVDAHFQRFVGGGGGQSTEPVTGNQTETNVSQWEVPGEHFPLIKVLHFQTDCHDVLVTAGMSIYPQPAVEMFVENPTTLRRTEIALLLDRSSDPSAPPPPMEIVNQLMGLALYPWHNFTYLAPGHTCNLSVGDCQVGLLIDDDLGSKIAGIDRFEIPAYREEQVNLLWLVPLDGATHDQLVAGTLNVAQYVSRLAK
jgi:hypothetical protein